MASSTPPRRRLIGLSTKMYFSLARTADFTNNLVSELSALPAPTRSLISDSVDVFLIPDFITILPTAKQLESSPLPVWLGAQDCHWDDSGAFTGEVSPAVLAEAGVRIVEVGHAERRRLFGEDDVVTARKAAAAARNGLVPLVCIGERNKTGDDDVAAQAAAAVQECRVQVDAVLAEVADGADVILAYEPVWAIGASQPAGEEHVLAVVDGLRGLEGVRSRKGSTRIVYGGSAGPGLFERLKTGVDGLFLGRFGHDVKQFLRTVQEVAEA